MFRLVVVAVCVVCVGAAIVSAQGRQGGAAQGRQGGAPAGPPQLRSGETYLWHGELVSFDPASRTLTVKTRLLRQAATDVERLNVGDRVLLTWSGQDIHAGGVRRVAKYDPAQRIIEFFALPAELGARDVAGDHEEESSAVHADRDAAGLSRDGDRDARGRGGGVAASGRGIADQCDEQSSRADSALCAVKRLADGEREEIRFVAEGWRGTRTGGMPTSAWA